MAHFGLGQIGPIIRSALYKYCGQMLFDHKHEYHYLYY